MSIEQTVAAFQELAAASNLGWEGRNLKIALRTPVQMEVLFTLETGDLFAEFSAAELQGAFDRKEPKTLAAGIDFLIRLPRAKNRLLIVRDLEEMLTVPGLQQEAPLAFGFLTPEGRLYLKTPDAPIETAPPLVQRYYRSIRLWKILERHAEYIDPTGSQLLFFGVRKTEIVPGFGVADLAQEVATGEISAFVDNPDRPETRKEIFLSALSEFLKDVHADVAFAYLVRGSAPFAQRLREGLAMYLAEHSPEKLAEEARSKALEFSERLEKIITGLETKSLSIPVALLLAVKDVSMGAGFTAMNAMLLFSALLYAITMTFVHRSQNTLLAVVKETLTTTQKRFMERGLERGNPILSTTFLALERRCALAATGSGVMAIASWIPIAGVVLAMYFCQPSAPSDVPSKPPVSKAG